MTNRRPTPALLILGLLPLLLASCSTAKGDDTDKLAVTRERIIRTFKEETGHGFIRRSVREEIREWADLPRFELLEPEQSGLLAKRYGFFTIYVYEDREARDRAISEEGQPDAEGRYWTEAVTERGPNAGETSWSADKRYGDNVVLNWGLPNGQREASASRQWGRLDSLLRRAVE